MKSEMEFTFEEPMDTSETPYHSNSEEGEIKSSDDERNDDVKIRDGKKDKKDDVTSKWFLGNYDLFDEDVNMKKLQRAERFGLPKKSEPVVTSKEPFSALHTDLGINAENERHYRFNTIHMKGAEDMTTDDVLQYFSLYDPSVIEWVDEVSCNVVWLDDVSASTALLNLSKRINNLEKSQQNSGNNRNNLIAAEKFINKDEEAVNAQDIPAVIPSGFWRLGKPCKKIPFPFLRFAAKSDKKQSNIDKNKDYYKAYSDPHYGNVPGILSKSLRTRMEMSKYNHQSSSNIWKREPKPVETVEKKNPWEELAYDWGKADKVERVFSPSPRTKAQILQTSSPEIPDLRVSLRHKKEKRKRLYREEDVHEVEEDLESRKKLPRMKMYADDEEKRLGKNSAIVKPMEDLRSKINRKKNRDKIKLIVEKVKVEKSDTSESENECVDEDMSSSWALENYKDLRKTLRHNRRDVNRRLESNRFDSEESDSDSNDIDFDINNIGQRSPLQIEIDNDGYYPKRSSKR